MNSDRLDIDKSGVIDASELRRGLRAVGPGALVLHSQPLFLSHMSGPHCVATPVLILFASCQTYWRPFALLDK